MNTLDSVLPHLLSSRFQTLDSADDKSISPVPIASEIRYALNNVMKTTEETNDVVVLKSMLEAYKTGMDALQAEVASLQQVFCLLVLLMGSPAYTIMCFFSKSMI